jgi:DNA-binding response OmpR family regulator
MSKRIVLVEDNPHDVFLIKEALRQAGLAFELVCYSDVPEAIAGLLDESNPPPDLILLDLNLPRGDGTQLIQIARARGGQKAVKVAVLTSSESPQDRMRSTAMGIDCYLVKPVSLDEFFGEIERAVKELLHENDSDRANPTHV